LLTFIRSDGAVVDRLCMHLPCKEKIFQNVVSKSILVYQG